MSVKLLIVTYLSLFYYLSATQLDSINEIKDKVSSDGTLQKTSEFEILPILSYDTDIGFGYGLKAFYYNPLGLNESFDIIAFNSTKGEKWYRLVFSLIDFERRQGKVYPLALDFSIDYDKIGKSSFFGIGNYSKFQDREYYSKEPLELNLTFSRGFTSYLVAGAGLKYRIINNNNICDTCLLIHTTPILNTGSVHATSIFISLRYDTRNSYINPSTGLVIQSECEIVPKLSINNVSYSRLSATFQYYTNFLLPDLILASRIGIETLLGNNLPVQVLLPLGGNRNLRGSPQDRYLDKSISVFNSELRFPIFWRFGGIAGFDAGKVWNSLRFFDFDNWHLNPTAGLRFYMDNFIVRLDIGFGTETTGFYLNFGHLF